MDFPNISNQELLNRLELYDGKINVVIDTDTYNEIDDQFALMYALRSTERLNIEAIYAAPFYNQRSQSPSDGMEKSYDEILKILDIMDIKKAKDFVFKGSTRYLGSLDTPCNSDATHDIIYRAMSEDQPLYIVAIGALTNIASAILMEPQIIKKIVVVWLGGHALNWPDTKEFNLMQDVPAARVLFDYKVPMVHIPCMGVVSHLNTTPSELDLRINGKSPIGTYLAKIFRELNWCGDDFAWSKVIWDISAIAYLINQNWVPTNLVHSPIITDQMTWSIDQSRHLIKSAYWVDRDHIFTDLFKKV